MSGMMESKGRKIEETEGSVEAAEENYKVEGDTTSECVCNMEWRGVKPGEEGDDCQCWDKGK